MNQRILAALILVHSALAAPLRAEPLSLPAALERARESAREVAAARARIEAADQGLRRARSYRLPVLSLQEIWLRTDSPAEAFALQLQQERFSFPEFTATDPNDPDPIENALTRLELTLPLWTGGELAGRIRQAGLAAEASREGASWVEDGAALAAAEAWIRLAQARERTALLERSLETVRAHAEFARLYVEQGMLVRSELLRAEVERARIEDLLSEARGQEKVAEAALSFRLTAGADASWELEPLPHPPPLERPLAEWLASAENRSDLEAGRRLVEAAELEIGVRRSALLPKLGLAARYDLNDESPFGTAGDSTSLMAMVRIDLFSSGRHRAAAAQARAEAEAAAHELELFREAIRLEVRAAYEGAASTRERHRTALAAQEAAAEGERITRERFAAGVVKTIDLLDAATARREAETRELVARAEAHLALLRLAVRSGLRPESVLEPGPEPGSGGSGP